MALGWTLSIMSISLLYWGPQIRRNIPRGFSVSFLSSWVTRMFLPNYVCWLQQLSAYQSQEECNEHSEDIIMTCTFIWNLIKSLCITHSVHFSLDRIAIFVLMLALQ